jgi:CHAT domain-containing protein
MAPARRSGALAGIRSLIVVPHGALAYLPFAALVDGETGRYLIERYALLTLPSAASLAVLRARASPDAAVHPPEVFAPDPGALPATRAEAEAVVRTLPRAQLRLGPRATEASVRGALASGAVVHLASHGELNPRNPMFSFLGTAGGGGMSSNDGRLEVHEVLGLKVASPLVFLSGCETGLGIGGSTGFATGEDFATLARAFLHAGARNVVATLWRVDDEGAAVFAREYYRRLASEGPVAALSGAQRAMVAGGPYATPYYWAGYTLAGDGRSLALRNPVVGVR